MSSAINPLKVATKGQIIIKLLVPSTTKNAVNSGSELRAWLAKIPAT